MQQQSIIQLAPETVIEVLNKLRDAAHQNSRIKGFYDDTAFNFAEKIALIHSELSEALESHRRAGITEPDDHCPDHPHVAVELCDAIIRIMDLAGYLGLDLGSAYVAKSNYNSTRPRKHGKNY